MATSAAKKKTVAQKKTATKAGKATAAKARAGGAGAKSAGSAGAKSTGKSAWASGARGAARSMTAKAGAKSKTGKAKGPAKAGAGGAAPEKSGFMWKLLQQKEAAIKKRNEMAKHDANDMNRAQAHADTHGFGRFNGPRRRAA